MPTSSWAVWSGSGRRCNWREIIMHIDILDYMGTQRFYNQQPISKESFFEIRDANDSSHRKVFSLKTAVQKNKQAGKIPSFSVSFAETILPIYEKMTGFTLNYSTRFGNYWHHLNSSIEVEAAEQWEKSQGDRVFLKDNLFLSVALCLYDRNNKVITNTGIENQTISSLFSVLKYRYGNINDDVFEQAFQELSSRLADTIRSLPFYSDCKYISAVPPRPGKTSFDLPSSLAADLAVKLNIEDITSTFRYTGEKAQGKTLSRDDKWAAWEAAGLSCTKDLEGKDVILIDDLYQSGISVNFVGMKLQEANCGKICGLYIVKSLNDKDNIQRTPGSE